MIKPNLHAHGKVQQEQGVNCPETDLDLGWEQWHSAEIVRPSLEQWTFLRNSWVTQVKKDLVWVCRKPIIIMQRAMKTISKCPASVPTPVNNVWSQSLISMCGHMSKPCFFFNHFVAILYHTHENRLRSDGVNTLDPHAHALGGQLLCMTLIYLPTSSCSHTIATSSGEDSSPLTTFGCTLCESKPWSRVLRRRERENRINSPHSADAAQTKQNCRIVLRPQKR